MRNNDPATAEEHPSTTSMGSRWPRRIFKLLLICIPLLAALVVLPPAVMILRAIVRPVPPPDAKPALERLLRRGDASAISRGDPATIHGTQDGGKVKTTSNVTTHSAVVELRFAPFLPATPDISEMLKQQQNQLNAEFDLLLREIEVYTNAASALKNTQARKQLDQISERWHRFQKHLNEIRFEPDEGGAGMTQARARYQDCLDWLWAANIANYVEAKRWFEAGCEASDQWLWKDEFPARRGRDWDRAVYYFWKAGGSNRNHIIVQLTIERAQFTFHTHDPRRVVIR